MITTAELAKKALAEIKLGDGASREAEKHYIAAGTFLLKAKDEVKRISVIIGGKVVRKRWAEFLEEHGIAERTAQLYMQLALNKTTLAKIRSANRAAAAKSRVKSALRHAESTAVVETLKIPVPFTRGETRKIPLGPPEKTASPPIPLTTANPDDFKTVNQPATVARPSYTAGKLRQLKDLVAALAVDVDREKNNLPDSFKVDVETLANDLLALIPQEEEEEQPKPKPHLTVV